MLEQTAKQFCLSKNLTVMLGNKSLHTFIKDYSSGKTSKELGPLSRILLGRGEAKTLDLPQYSCTITSRWGGTLEEVTPIEMKLVRTDGYIMVKISLKHNMNGEYIQAPNETTPSFLPYSTAAIKPNYNYQMFWPRSDYWPHHDRWDGALYVHEASYGLHPLDFAMLKMAPTKGYTLQAENVEYPTIPGLPRKSHRLSNLESTFCTNMYDWVDVIIQEYKKAIRESFSTTITTPATVTAVMEMFTVPAAKEAIKKRVRSVIGW